MRNPAVGDHVRVPWGLDVLDGVVVQTYSTGSGRRAVVQVSVPGATEEDSAATTVTLPVDALEPADWWPDESEPVGGWVAHASYERHVADALTRAVSEPSAVRASAERPYADLGYDLVLNTPKGNVVTQIKYASRPGGLNEAIRRELARLRELAIRASNIVGVLFITNAQVTAPTTKLLKELAANDPPVRLVTWRSPKDDEDLASTLAEWLNEPSTDQTPEQEILRDVVPDDGGGWNVLKPGSSRVSVHTRTKKDAIARAQRIVRNAGGGQVRVYDREGHLEDRDTILPT